MKTIIRIFLFLILTSMELAADPNALSEASTWAVVISGINKDPDEQQFKAQAVLHLKRYFQQQLEISEDKLFVMTGKESVAFQPSVKEATSENIEQVLKAISESIRPRDSFIFYYVGQANVIKEKLRLNLPGVDLQHDKLADHLNAIKAKQSLIVLDCPGAGLAIQSLVKPGRIIIAGAQANQPWSTRFSQYFIPAISDKHADYNQDEKISILEAFRYAVMRLDDYYRQRDLFKTENPLLEDDGNGIPSQQPWQFMLDGNDGLIASKFFLIKNDQ